MKLKKTLLLSTVLLAIAACTDKDNSVKVEMTNCEGTLCSFDASKSKVKEQSHVLEYNWNFHDDTDVAITKAPKVEHDFNLLLGATANGEGPDLDLREVTLDQVLTNHQIVSKTFKFRTHEHDPKALFLAKKSEELGLSEDAQLFDLDASESDPGQGSIKEYIWEVDGKKTVTETPELKQEFTDKSSGDVKLTVVNSFGVEQSTTENVLTGVFSTRPKAVINVIPHEDGVTYTLDGSASEAGKKGGVKKPVKEWMWTIDNNGFWPESGEKIDVKFETPGIHTVKLFVISSLNDENLTDSTEVTVDVREAVSPAFTSDVTATAVKDSDGLHYDFAVNTNEYDKSKYDLVWILNDETITSTKNVAVKEGANTVVAKLVAKDGTGEVVADKSKNFEAKAVITPAFTSEVSATEVKDSDGLHYDFAVNTNEYDKSKYDLVWTLNDETITSTKNVAVKEGANTVVAKLVSKDGTVEAKKSTSFEASEIVKAVISKATLATDGLTYTFNTDGSTKGDGYKYEWRYGVDDSSVGEGTIGKWAYPAIYTDASYKVTLTITSPNGKKVSSTPYEVTVKALSKPTSKISVTPDANNGLKFHFSREIDWNGRNPNDFTVKWLVDGSTKADFSGDSFDYEFSKDEEGSHYVKLTLIEKSTKLEFKSEPVNINVKDTTIPYEKTPAAIIGQGIHSGHKGNSGASFPYITIDLDGSVANKGAKFVTGDRFWNGSSSGYTKPYEQGDNYLHFNTGSATSEGYYDFSLEVANGDIHQKATYSCKQKTTLWVLVWEPDLVDCTAIKWGTPYKV
mgnify:CR=1 FL=1